MRVRVAFLTENPPHSQRTISLPTRGIAEARLVITVATQKDICPHGNTYPKKAVPISKSKITTPIPSTAMLPRSPTTEPLPTLRSSPTLPPSTPLPITLLPLLSMPPPSSTPPTLLPTLPPLCTVDLCTTDKLNT